MQAFGRLGRAFLLGAAAGAVLALVGIAASLDVLALVGGILAVNFLVLGLVFLLLQRRLFGDPKALARVATEGMPVTATVTDVGTTASRVGANPIMKLGLNVNMQSVTLRTVVPVNKAGLLHVGASLPVRVDSDDPTVCVVDWDAVA